MSFDILIASYGRADILQKCLISLSGQVIEELQEIIILIQDTDIQTLKIIENYETKLCLKILKTEFKLRPGASRNLLIKNSTSEYICFLDDDTVPPSDYLVKAVEIIKRHKPDIFGGPDRSADHDGLRQTIIGDILSSVLVMGPTFYRHSSDGLIDMDSDETSLTLCNIWIKKVLFEQYNIYFDEDLKRCEENKLLVEFSKKNIKMSYWPELYVYHLRRESIFQIARIQFLSGFYRSTVFFKQMACFRAFFLIPLLTGVLIVLFPLLNPKLQISLFVMHTILSWFVSFKIFLKRHKIIIFFYAWIVIVTIHIFFSLGMLLGILTGIFNARKSRI